MEFFVIYDKDPRSSTATNGDAKAAEFGYIQLRDLVNYSMASHGVSGIHTSTINDNHAQRYEVLYRWKRPMFANATDDVFTLQHSGGNVAAICGPTQFASVDIKLDLKGRRAYWNAEANGTEADKAIQFTRGALFLVAISNKTLLSTDILSSTTAPYIVQLETQLTYTDLDV